MFKLATAYDVIVVGSGHAGIEAALAAARIGCRTLMLTQNLDTIGQMSCNPAIGGLAKGHIVREIDALGGAMGLNADATGIQFRMLNRRKGPSVRAPRVQCDKKAYQFRMKAILEAAQNLDVKQGTVSRLLYEAGAAVGVETDMQHAHKTSENHKFDTGVAQHFHKLLFYSRLQARTESARRQVGIRHTKFPRDIKDGRIQHIRNYQARFRGEIG